MKEERYLIIISPIGNSTCGSSTYKPRFSQILADQSQAKLRQQVAENQSNIVQIKDSAEISVEAMQAYENSKINSSDSLVSNGTNTNKQGNTTFETARQAYQRQT